MKKKYSTNSCFWSGNILTLLFLVLGFSIMGYAQNGPDCPSGVCIGPGGPISSGSLTISSNAYYSSITVKNGATLTVKSGFTLYVGQVGTSSSTPVMDFQNGCTVIIEAGASLIVNGLLNNSNNSNGVVFNGVVSVTGNVKAGNGSVIAGTGGLDVTGSINNSGSVFGSTADCAGPCSYSTCLTRPNAPGIGTITQTTCASDKGSVVLSGLPTSALAKIYQIGTASSSISITGATMTISGLAAGKYQFYVSNGSCSSATTKDVIINPVVTNTWTGSWSNGVPTIDHKLVFSSDYSNTNDVDLEGCSCKVTGSTIVRIKSGRTMRIKNDVDVQSTASLIFEDTSSLVQINDDAVNTGNIIYKREITPFNNFDYTYWCAPVTGQKLIDFSPGTLGDKFLSFDSFVNNWKYEDAYNNFMNKGTGYIIRAPQSHMAPTPPFSEPYQFKGVPNNGVVKLPIGAAGNSVLIGNPYPSALDADKFLDANAARLEGTIYFWTRNTSLRLASSLPAGTAGSGTYAYTSDDYAAYNRTGGVSTAYVAASGINNQSSPLIKDNAPTYNIGSGQSFFGTSKAAGDVIYNNSMRVGYTTVSAGANSQFFKTESTKKTTVTTDKSRIWIDLTNEEGAFKETLLGYITGATNAFETAFDGESYDANAFVDFYSINEDKKLTIQGRALPFDDSEIIPLGYKANIGGQFSITIRDKDGLFTTQNVYLEDKLLGTVIDLSEGTYKFTTEIGVFNDRLAIRYTSKTLGVEVVDPVAEGVYISTKNKVITVQVGTETIAAAYVYDLAGKQLFAKKAVDSNQMSISNLSAANVVLVVKVVLNNGSVVTQKIVY
ncbi:MAG: T9SS sorting signal type C domain-containing protein [Bacteroidetes bacterium]|nr:T9SS sorting signal type C domain-containing protein [Bacteroidota bacterium]